MTDLLREISLDVEVSYMKVKSYDGTTSTGNISITLESDIEVTGRDVLLVEDIIDTGKTMKLLTQTLLARNPHSVHVVSLLDKPERREVAFSADYVGKVIDDVFVVGYGMDYNEQYRNIPYVGIVDLEE
jgi:hypoxanthine phosphoribosyltransferase